MDKTKIPVLYSHHLSGDLFSGQVECQEGVSDPWASDGLGAEPMRPPLSLGLGPGWVPPGCQAANNSELLPNTKAAGVRGRWQRILLQALGLWAPA